MGVDQLKKVEPNRYYFWSDRTKIFKTYGAANDLVLDGEFTKFYSDGQIFEKGKFDQGLKDGVWRIWNNDGSLQKEEFYDSGLLHGEITTFFNDTTIIQEYRKGLQHGHKKWVYNDDVVKDEKYRKGHLVQRDEKRTKSKEKKAKKRILIFNRDETKPRKERRSKDKGETDKGES